MNSPEIQNLKKENYAEYRKKYLIINLRTLNGTVISAKMEKNYTVRNKWSHIGTKKHERNYYNANPLIKL